MNRSFLRLISTLVLPLLILLNLNFDLDTYIHAPPQQSQHSYRTRFDAKNNTRGTALCCIAIAEEAYIDEFVDYHHALGFNSIHVYDNTDENALKQWGDEKGNHVTVIHYPGRKMQRSAYLDCAKKRKEDGNYTWVAFHDIDEFLILKKHEHIEDFLLEHLSSGALSINWLVFRTCGRIAYSPLPVTKRFLYRENSNQHVKSIVRLRDMNMKIPPYPHHLLVVNGTQHDTNGKRISGSFNPSGPIDVAVIHHYHTKSYREVLAKYTRGRATMNNGYASGTGPEYENYKKRIDKVTESYKAAIVNPKINDDSISVENMIFDDTAWLKVKKYVPEYALFDTLP